MRMQKPSVKGFTHVWTSYDVCLLLCEKYMVCDVTVSCACMHVRNFEESKVVRMRTVQKESCIIQLACSFWRIRSGGSHDFSWEPYTWCHPEKTPLLARRHLRWSVLMWSVPKQAKIVANQPETNQVTPRLTETVSERDTSVSAAFMIMQTAWIWQWRYARFRFSPASQLREHSFHSHHRLTRHWTKPAGHWSDTAYCKPFIYTVKGFALVM